jgi:hypothetical protein
MQYVSEAVSAVAEATLKTKDIPAAVEVSCCKHLGELTCFTWLAFV